jgi:hypothetical protein
MTTATPTLDQVIDLAHRLPREQRGQLIAHLALELATDAPARPTITPDASHTTWAQLRTELSARPAGSTSMAEQLDADRRSRDQALTGHILDKDDDVHS